MDNIFTPEEANKAVTYGELLKIFMPIIEEMSKGSINYADTLQQQTFDIINKLTDHIVKIRDDAEYRRIRDVSFVLHVITCVEHLDKDVLRQNYYTWCTEYDSLNKPKTE